MLKANVVDTCATNIDHICKTYFNDVSLKLLDFFRTDQRFQDPSLLESMCVAALSSLKAGFKLGYLLCPRCKGEHLDSENWALKYHSPHLCLNCGILFKAEREVIGNPLAQFDVQLRDGKLDIHIVPRVQQLYSVDVASNVPTIVQLTQE